MKYKIKKLHEYKNLINISADWFHLKWNLSVEVYLKSMEKCIENKRGCEKSPMKKERF